MKGREKQQPNSPSSSSQLGRSVEAHLSKRGALEVNPSGEALLPCQGRLAGVDYGTVRIGLAISDPSQQWVTPYDTYLVRGNERDSEYFCTLADKEQLTGWVLGLPIHCDGRESRKSEEVRKFASWLWRLTGIPHSFYDERFSTREARRLLQDSGLGPKQKKKRLDRLAAHLILSHFLDFRRNAPSGMDAAHQIEALDD